jgi:hypothetical protein
MGPELEAGPGLGLGFKPRGGLYKPGHPAWWQPGAIPGRPRVMLDAGHLDAEMPIAHSSQWHPPQPQAGAGGRRKRAIKRRSPRTPGYRGGEPRAGAGRLRPRDPGGSAPCHWQWPEGPFDSELQVKANRHQAL